jgi:hypothetical protein
MCFISYRSRDGSVCMVVATGWTDGVRFLTGARDFFVYFKRPDRLRLNLIKHGYNVAFFTFYLYFI